MFRLEYPGLRFWLCRKLPLIVVFGAIPGCSSTSDGLTRSNTGGFAATGGSTNVGATTSGSPATGGTQATNATTVAIATGGRLSAAGGVSAATGGESTATGGASAATGGTSAVTGGSNATGGRATGGASATGGGLSVGGATEGGATTTGGTFATGGISSAGGLTATGGRSSNTGGTAAITTGGSEGSSHWVGTWSASPYYDSANQPPSSLTNSVLRQVVHVSLGGSQIRVQFSNLFGNGPVTINSAHVALCKSSPAVDSSIDTATDKSLAFSGVASVTIAQGKEIWSDPVDFVIPALANVTITAAFGSVPSNVVGHSGSRTTSYLQTGSSNVTAASMTSAQKTDHWYYISGIDVMAAASAKAAVVIGDSITDGRGTDTNMNNRWTDIASARMRANPATANVSMLNQGIGATNLVGSSGTAAQARFNRDVLEQSGARYAIVYDGVNDIGADVPFASMKVAYDDLISRAHAKGLVIYGATIMPFGGNSYYTAAHESVRQQVNTYIKSGVFDGYIDFDAALTDGGNPPKLQATFAQWAQTDGLHPGPAGYKKMGDSVDLNLFTK